MRYRVLGMNRMRGVRVLGALCLAASLACSDSIVVAPINDLEQVYWSLRVNHLAVQMSLTNPYDTLTLEANPYTSAGNPWTPSHDADSLLAASPTIWTSVDSSKVHVSADGHLKARAVTPGVLVIATRQIRDVTNIDTVRVQVANMPSPPVVKTFRMRPADSLKRAMSSVFQLVPVILDQNDKPVTGIPVAVFTENRDLLRCVKWTTSCTVWASNGGTTKVTTSTWAYGVILRDSFTFESGWPVNPITGNPGVIQRLALNRTAQYSGGSVRSDIGPGSWLYWANNSGVVPVDTALIGAPLPGTPMDVIFDDPTQVLAVETPASNSSGSGNILGIPSDISLTAIQRRRYRRFLQPGEYWYTIQPFGVRGVVIVHDR